MKHYLSILSLGFILASGTSHGQIVDPVDGATGWIIPEAGFFSASPNLGLTATAGDMFFAGNTNKLIGISREFTATYTFDTLYTATFDVGNPDFTDSPMGTPIAYFIVDVDGDGYQWSDVIQGGGRSLTGTSPAEGTWETWTITQTFTDGMTTVGGHTITTADNVAFAMFINPPGNTWAERESVAFDNLMITGPVVAAPQWAGYEIDEMGIVDTGAWLGLLYVENDPWIWSYSLETWLYLPPEAISETGSWSYVTQ